jgi:hypothetical protein
MLGAKAYLTFGQFFSHSLSLVLVEDMMAVIIHSQAVSRGHCLIEHPVTQVPNFQTPFPNPIRNV